MLAGSRHLLQVRLLMTPAKWDETHLQTLQIAPPDADGPSDMARSKYNPTPGACQARRLISQSPRGPSLPFDGHMWRLAGTGRTGFMAVAPNDYPFYGEHEKYVPIMQADGGQLSGAKCPCACRSLVYLRLDRSCDVSSPQSGCQCTIQLLSRPRLIGRRLTRAASHTVHCLWHTCLCSLPASWCA
jgi:hypothetical protein